jgi:predicted PurR-regulated permease PerM
MDKTDHPHPHAGGPDHDGHHASLGLRLDRGTRRLVLGIFIILMIGFLYMATTFMLPVVAAFLFALILGPLARWLRRRGVPGVAAAAGLVVILFVVLTAGGYLLSAPISSFVSDAPRITAEVQRKLSVVRRPMEAITRASAQLQKLTTPDGEGSTARVVVEPPSQLSSIATGAGETAVEILLFLVLLLFILSSGDLFSEKLVKVLPTLSDKKKALRIAREIEHEVSRYMVTVTVINFCFGGVVAVVFWTLGMPSPILWGLVAALLNFLPFLGTLIGTVASTAIAVIAFDTLPHAALIPAAYILLHILEGEIITPLILGRRLEMNSVAILISIAFWGWLWGFVGALLAVPILVTVKVFADHVDGMHAIGEFLGAKSPPLAAQEPADDEEAVKVAAKAEA